MATQRRDFYDVLQISRGATQEEIEKAFKKLARQYHPDRNIGDPDAELKFKEVNEAYEILKDPEKRAAYDRYGHAAFENGGGGFGPDIGINLGDILGSVFGDLFGGGGRRGHGPQPGRHLQVVLDLTLVEAATGGTKTVKYRRADHCPECSGKGSKSGKRTKCSRCDGRGAVVMGRAGDFFSVQRTCPACGGQGAIIDDPCSACRGAGRSAVERTFEVTIPPGVDTGMRIGRRGEGDAGDQGAPRGDLEIVLRVADHPDFHRDGDHLICQVPITYSQATLGGTQEIPTLTGKATLNIPKGTQSHTEIRIRGEGMPILNSGNRKGDLRVLVVVEIPTTLNKRQEELLRELAEIDQKHVSPARKTLLDRVKGFFGASSGES